MRGAGQTRPVDQLWLGRHRPPSQRPRRQPGALPPAPCRAERKEALHGEEEGWRFTSPENASIQSAPAAGSLDAQSETKPLCSWRRRDHLGKN